MKGKGEPGKEEKKNTQKSHCTASNVTHLLTKGYGNMGTSYLLFVPASIAQSFVGLSLM